MDLADLKGQPIVRQATVPPRLRTAAANAGSRESLSANEIERRCRAAGLKMTPQRHVIARVLSGEGDHPSVEELYCLAQSIDSKISIATVYRTVRLFEEKGILSRLDFGEGRARYEASDSSPHYHLIDVITGKVIEFQDEVLDVLLRKIATGLGFEPVSIRLELFGKRPTDRIE